jgi:hypothetical protein
MGIFAVWVGMAMSLLGSDIMPEQGVTSSEKPLTLPRETETVVIQDRIHKIEIHWINDAKGDGVRVVKILADPEKNAAQPGGGTLPLMPPGNKPSSQESNSEAAGTTKEMGPAHEPSWWVFPLAAITGVGLPILIIIVLDAYRCRLPRPVKSFSERLR